MSEPIVLSSTAETKLTSDSVEEEKGGGGGGVESENTQYRMIMKRSWQAIDEKAKAMREAQVRIDAMRAAHAAEATFGG